MTDRTTRDEIARILRETYDREFDGVGGEWPAMADALINAGLVVPAGLTAEKLRDDLAQMLRERYQNTTSLPESPNDIARDASEAVIAWFAELRETP